VRPEVELYVTPLQIDPLAPALPISTPPDYAAQLAEVTGRYYTQGIPEDTKIYTEEIFDRDEFLSQSRIVRGEIARQFEHVLGEFREGLLFYYFGFTDQVSHLFWGSMDPEHPTYDPAVDPRYAGVVPELYEEADRLVGYALDHLPPEATLVVMSDHGFASWRRAFNLNSWLRDNGYLAVKNPTLAKDPGLFFNVDWSRTRAYGVGFNGLYLNVRGREKHGIVEAAQGPALLEEIGAKLLATTDPETGLPAVTRVYPTAEAFRHDQLAVGPDMVVGYAEGTRAANEGVLGELTPEVITDNTGRWTGDHGMDPTTVPGVLYTNRKLSRPVESLENLAAAVLAEFGIASFPPAAPPAP
jgi:predicted AlkP superfamily phosphohydrolase/phosphomutase